MGKKDDISQRQRLAAILMSAGVNQSETARIIGVHKNQITRWKKQKAFSEYLAEKMAQIEKRIETARDILIESAPMAALKMLNLLDGEEENTQRLAASDILDRVGISKTTKIEGKFEGMPAVVEIHVQREEAVDDRGQPPDSEPASGPE